MRLLSKDILNLKYNNENSYWIKKTKPIIIGDTMFPRSIPNLNQSLFNGNKRLEFKMPKTKNIKEIIKDQSLILSLLIKG